MSAVIIPSATARWNIPVSGRIRIPAKAKTTLLPRFSIFFRPSFKVCSSSSGPPNIIKCAHGISSWWILSLTSNTSEYVKLFPIPARVVSHPASVPSSIAASPDSLSKRNSLRPKFSGLKKAHQGSFVFFAMSVSAILRYLPS